MDLLLVLLMSFDALLACTACGARRIAIPWRSVLVIASIGTLCLGLSFVLSHLLASVLPASVFRLIGCGALFVIAFLCLFDEFCRRVSGWLSERCSPFQFKLRNLRFVLEVYAENTRADRDQSGTLSPAEAVLLALPLSLDSLLTGLSITAGAPVKCFLLLFCMVCGCAAARLGSFVGLKFQRAAGQSASVLSGVLLLCIAFFKLLV